jgi:hypothetical protein
MVSVREIRDFFRQNPQVLVLLVVCLVLGLGTFFAVIFGVLSAHSTTGTGEPSGSITLIGGAVNARVPDRLSPGYLPVVKAW